MEDIDIREIILIIRKRWKILVGATGVCVIVSALLSFFFLSPVYESNTSLYVGRNETNPNTAIAYNDLLLGERLVNDYREFIKSRLITGMVIQEMGLQHITPEGLAAKLEVNSKKETRLIEITVQDGNPQLAKNIADKIAVVFQSKVIEIMQVENVQVIDVANLPLQPVRPDKKMNIAIAFLLGLVLGAGAIFVAEFLDNTIKTPDDVKKHLELPVIGSIPLFPE